MSREPRCLVLMELTLTRFVGQYSTLLCLEVSLIFCALRSVDAPLTGILEVRCDGDLMSQQQHWRNSRRPGASSIW